MKMIFLFLLVIMLTGNGYAQGGATRTRRVPTERIRKKAEVERIPSPLEQSADEIEEARPEVSYETLFRDMQAVQASLPAIRYIYSQRGFDYEEADRAAMYGWKQLRSKQLEPAAVLSPKVLIDYVSGFGKLIINSKPLDATIELDGDTLHEKTMAISWPSAGAHRVKLSMEGYEDVEDTCVIEEGKVTRFERELKKVKKKN
jgi:hypothetical protein